jgi:hypothetical protein
MILLSIAAIAASTGTAGARFPTPSPIPDTVVLPGDETLACPDIRAEGDYRMSQYNSLGRERDGMGFQKGAESKALEAVGMIGGAIPVIGGLISMGSAMAQMGTAKKDAEANYGEIDRKSEWVLNRMSHMHETYRTQCMRGKRQ